MFEQYRYLYSKSPIGSVPCCIPETEAMIRYLSPPSTHPRVIDVGAGQGSWTQNLRSRGYTVTPVDLDNSQFAENIVADMHELPFPDSSFDIVFCTGAFEHAFAPFVVLSEFRRICRNGGMIAMTLPIEDNVKMLEDAGHYCAISKLQMERMYCTKLGFTLDNYEKGIWNDIYGPHQVFVLGVHKS